MIFLNGEAFIAEAIESVIAQTFDGWELLLVDDGSGPAATTIAKDYVNRYPGKIRYFEHPGHINRGMSATRNLGIRHARGEYIAFIDVDDCFLPSKLSDEIALLDAHLEVGLVCGAAIYWNSWSTGTDIVRQVGHRQNVVLYPPEALLSVYPLGYSEAPTGYVVRTDIVRLLGGFEEQFTGMFEDQAFLVKLYFASPVYFSSTPSVKYRQHPDSCCAVAANTEKLDNARQQFFDWFEAYLKARAEVETRVAASLRWTVMRYRHPRIYYILKLPARFRNRYRRLRSSIGQVLRQRLSA
jgi:glycosyltransferase involved in cell wall biosynthesis